MHLNSGYADETVPLVRRFVRPSADAEVCTAGDNSCLMHIGGGLSRMGAPARTVHLAEILAAAEAGGSMAGA